MEYQYRIVSVQKRPDLNPANAYATVEFVDENGKVANTQDVMGVDLSVDTIDTWAGKIIAYMKQNDDNVATADASLTTLQQTVTIGELKTPTPPDPDAQALADAQATLQAAIQKAQIPKLVEELADPDVTAAYAVVQTAQATVDAKAEIATPAKEDVNA